MKQVEFWDACGWTCDNCGRDNVARMIMQQGPEQGGFCVTTVSHAQKIVTCAFCGEQYEVPPLMPLKEESDDNV